MHLSTDGKTLVTGSADKDVKFWELEYETAASSYMPTNVQSLAHVRTLKMTDDVLCVRFSPNGKLLAVALLDSTVKIFYQDTLKFFLSLYGHKVSPVIPTLNAMLMCVKNSFPCSVWIFQMTPRSS